VILENILQHSHGVFIAPAVLCICAVICTVLALHDIRSATGPSEKQARTRFWTIIACTANFVLFTFLICPRVWLPIFAVGQIAWLVLCFLLLRKFSRIVTQCRKQDQAA
jgi:tetrahydromethanopterin S-methyltransferase subunit C